MAKSVRNKTKTAVKKKTKLTKNEEAAYRKRAKELHHDEGLVEVDSNARISWVAPVAGGDGGAYVEAWMWVADEELVKGKK